MAPRKRTKGKKPTETMRQRQQRLLREQRAARNRNVRSQKALPPKTTTGGRRYSAGTASSRRAQAAAKQARAAQGTKGSTVRQGQPAGAANRYFGADRVARSVRRAQIETAARRFAQGKGGLLTAVAAGAALGEAYKKTNRVKAESGRGAGRRTFNEKSSKPKQTTKKTQPKSKVKVQTDNTTVTRKKSRDYQAEKKAREAKAAKPSQSKQQTQTPKPKVKKGSGVERRLPKAKERKDRAYSAVQELRAMRERSKQRQAAMKKKKK